jgi:parallel beta-helix repeat protein
VSGYTAKPKRTIGAVMALLTAGDTVYVDAGTYYPSDTITIDTNGVFFIGKDSASTIIDFNDTTHAGARAIHATGRQNLTLRDFTVRRGYRGIWWNNVDTSKLERVLSDTHGQHGIYLENGSDSNTLTSNTISGNSEYGIRLESSNNNTLTSNTSTGNSGSGIYLYDNCNNNTLTSNTSTGNSGTGIYLYDNSNNNTLTSNTSTGNSVNGIRFSSSSNNTLASNTISGNSENGIRLANSNNNTLTSNMVDSNANWGIRITGTSATDTFHKNIIITPPDKPDSGVSNISTAGSRFDFTRNVWLRAGMLTTDSAVIRGMIAGTSEAHRDSVVFTPFRLGIVDTAPGADTVAPRAPVMDTGIAMETGALIRWLQVAQNEDGSVVDGFAGYRIYRSTSAALNDWKSTAVVIDSFPLAVTVEFMDTSVLGGIFYYRMTAYDNHPIPNESFFSDSIIEVILGPTKPQLVAPGDTATTADTRPVFQWTGSNTDTYTLQISTDSGFATIVDSVTTSGAVTAAQPGRDLVSDTYYWRVLAALHVSPATETSAFRQLVINTALVDTIPPEPFDLISPATGFETNLATPLFRWNLTTDTWSGVKEYRLQADTAGLFNPPLAETTVGATISQANLTLSGPDQNWSWRVIAVDNAGRTRVSGPRTIRIDTLVTVTLVAPDSGAAQDSRPVFQWSGVSADTYRLQVDSSGAFAGAMDVNVETTVTSFQPAGLDSAIYQWRVIGSDALGNNTTTETRIQIVDTGTAAADNTPPLAFSLASPANNHETNAASGVRFRWDAATDTGAGLKEYVLEISRSAAFASVDVAETVGATVTGTTVALAGVDTYYWRVVARDLAPAANVRYSSETRTVFVDTAVPTAPVPATPTGGVETTATTIRFVWNASTDTGLGLAGYRLQFSKAPDIGAETITVFDTTTATETPTAALTPAVNFSATETWYWRVRAEDRAGNLSAWSAVDSFTRPTPTDTTAPLPVRNLAATALETTSIRLDWDRSPSGDVTQYSISWNEGVSLDAPDTFLAAVVHSGDAHGFVTAVLTAGVEYRFKVTAQDTAGNVSAPALVSAVARSGANPVATATMTIPENGAKLNAGDTVPVILAFTGTTAQIDAVLNVRYQFRRDGSLDWVDLAPGAAATNPLPRTAIDAFGNMTFPWRIGSAIPDTYELRFIVTATSGDTSGPIGSAAMIRIVDPAVDTPTFSVTSTDTANIIQSQLHVNVGETIIVRNNPDTQTGMLYIPAGAVPAATDTQAVFIIVAMNTRFEFDALLPGGAARAADVMEVTLSNGDTQLAGGAEALVTLTFLDANLDGFVDGTRVPWSTLRIFRHPSTAGGSWEERPTLASQSPTAANGGVGWLRATTTRFSIFQLVGTAVSNNLANFSVGPNPFRPNDGNAATGLPYTGAVGTGIYFSNLPAGVKIEVFTITGRRVMEFQSAASTGQIQWDVRNQDGRDVASGVYLYRIQDMATGQVRTGKLTVIR